MLLVLHYSVAFECRFTRESIADHPLDVLLYSVRHKHEDIINECAEASINMSTTDMLRSLPSDIFAAWVGHRPFYFFCQPS